MCPKKAKHSSRQRCYHAELSGCSSLTAEPLSQCLGAQPVAGAGPSGWAAGFPTRLLVLCLFCGKWPLGLRKVLTTSARGTDSSGTVNLPIPKALLRKPWLLDREGMVEAPRAPLCAMGPGSCSPYVFH